MSHFLGPNMMCVLPQVLHFRNLCERVTAWVLGKLQHYVPGDNEILLSSCTLGALSTPKQANHSKPVLVRLESEFLRLCSPPAANVCTAGQYVVSNLFFRDTVHTVSDQVRLMCFSCTVLWCVTITVKAMMKAQGIIKTWLLFEVEAKKNIIFLSTKAVKYFRCVT